MMEENRIKRHFEEEAREYDEIILRLIPNYRLMVEVLVSLLQFDTERSFRAIDLGCGTGTVSKAVTARFPNVQLTCVDIAQNMLELASAKNGPDTRLIRADLNKFTFDQKYDAVLSSLALHHLETDADQRGLYQAIYDALDPGGMFVNIDVVLGGDAALQGTYLQKWKEFMLQCTPVEEIEGKWLPNYYAEDRPMPLMTHLDMMREAGFAGVDVAYKYYNYAVYCGKK